MVHILPAHSAASPCAPFPAKKNRGGRDGIAFVQTIFPSKSNELRRFIAEKNEPIKNWFDLCLSVTKGYRLMAHQEDPHGHPSGNLSARVS